MRNATYLFRESKNSESRWTAVAQVSLIYMSAEILGCTLPVYISDVDGYLTECSKFQALGFSCSNTSCETAIEGELFNNQRLPNEYCGIKPDILHISDNRVILIEVKTIGESVRRNLQLYEDFSKFLVENGFSCTLYYLLSHGHETLSDWRLLSEHGSGIILWEDLFSVMSKTPISYLIGKSIDEYCEAPAKQG